MVYDDYASASSWLRKASALNDAEVLENGILEISKELSQNLGFATHEQIEAIISAHFTDLESHLKPIVAREVSKLGEMGKRKKEAEEERIRKESAERELTQMKRKKLQVTLAAEAELGRIEFLKAQEKAIAKEAEQNRIKTLRKQERKARKRAKLAALALQKKNAIESCYSSIIANIACGRFEFDIPQKFRGIISKKDIQKILHPEIHKRLSVIIHEISLPEFDQVSERLPNYAKKDAEEVKRAFVGDVILRETGDKLDNDQLEAVIATEGHLRVTARAGSGKTRVLVAKAFYLIRFYNVDPNSLLLLAFNKKAANEISGRLSKFLKTDRFDTARTFHSLAYQIAKPTGSVVVADTDPERDQVGRIIEALLRDLWRPDILVKLYVFFRKEAKEFEGMGLHLDESERYSFRRAHVQATLRGEQVRSSGEKYIADFLFEHGISYKYEPSIRMGSDGVYRPDFGIWMGEGTNRQNFILEHWAFDPSKDTPRVLGDWTTDEIETYRRDVPRKREFWRTKSMPLLETHHEMVNSGREAFEGKLKALLESKGIPCNKLSQEILYKRLEDVMRSRLTTMLTQFVNRSLSVFDGVADMERSIRGHQATDSRERFFLKLGAEITKRYIRHLNENDLNDFNLFFPKAREVLDTTHTIPKIHSGGGRMVDLKNLQWIFVDEAQDASPQYLGLLNSIRQIIPNVRLMFVGDDWQAINRFAGANVELFNNMHDVLGNLSSFQLKKNYRSRSTIVEIGNRLMGGSPDKAAQPVVDGDSILEEADLDDVWLEFRKGEEFEDERILDEQFRWGDNPRERAKNDSGDGKARLTKLLFMILNEASLSLGSVAVLFRTRKFKGTSIENFKRKILSVHRAGATSNKLLKALQNNTVFDTAHSVKGKEYETVILISPHEGAFPLIHSSTSLFRVFGDSPERSIDDERRLFYVALTRAKRRIVLLREDSKMNESPFLKNIYPKFRSLEVRENYDDYDIPF